MTLLWLPKYVDIHLGGNIGMAGKYRLVVKEADGYIAKDTGWFNNIITNIGMDEFATSGGGGSYGVIGTGTATPAATDTALTGPITASNIGVSSVTAAGSPTYKTSVVYTYRFNIGSLNGTYTEVGLSNSVFGSSLKSRALILDGGGAPTSLAVTPSQQMDMYYTLERFPPLVDTSNTVTIDGVSTTITGRAAEVDGWTPIRSFEDVAYTEVFGGSTSLGAITGNPSGGTYGGSGSGGAVAYTPGSFTRTSSVGFGTGTGNVAGGVSHIAKYWQDSLSGRSAAKFQYALSANIMKDATKTMALSFSITWARA